MSSPPPPPAHIFGRRMRALREERGLSTRQLAERMQRLGFQWHHATVQRTEAADRPVRLDEALAIAGILRVDLSLLLRNPDDGTLRTRRMELEHRAKQLEKARIEAASAADKLAERVEEYAERIAMLQADYQSAASDLEMARAEMQKIHGALDMTHTEIAWVEDELMRMQPLPQNKRPDA